MKDFDQERAGRGTEDREFRIAGEVFTRRVTVRPETLSAWNGLSPVDADAHALQVCDETIMAILVPEDVAKWEDVRGRTDEPITAEDMGLIVQWALEGMARRPTDPSLGSATTPSATDGTTSTDVSASPVEAA